METKKRKIVYDGVNEVMNGKAAFMEQCMRVYAIREMLADRLAKDEKLRKKLHCVTADLMKEWVYYPVPDREDMIVLYDALYERQVYQFVKNTNDPKMLRYVLPMQLDGTEMKLDVTYFIVYGIMINPSCREAFYKEVDALEELYRYYDRSGYKNRYFEKCFQIQDVWEARALVGLLEKMRREEAQGESYRFLLKIIYAGYGYMKGQIKSRECITGRWIKEFLQDEAESHNMLSLVSKIFVLLAIAEDVEVPYVWDYEMLVMFRSFQEFQEEMECGIVEHDGLQFFEYMDYSDFLHRFDEEYKTHSSLFQLLQQEGNPTVELLVSVMSLYEVNPRKFWNDELSEKEVESLLRQSERWSVKNYWFILIIAQLCKYIQKIEEQYLQISGNQNKIQI